MPKMIN